MDKKECIMKIAEDLLAIGVKPGGALMVHSSFKSLGPVPGGIETVIEGLKLALGPQGTLLMPGLCWEAVSGEQPVYNVRTTPTCVGAIPEYFRRMEGTLRSLHPTHSVCGQGALAAELFEGHIKDTTPCGRNSPFARLKDYGGQVLMLGCGMLCNTSIHAVEEAAGAPYLFLPDPVKYTIVDCDGKETKVLHRRHANFPQNFDRVRPQLLGHGLAEGNVLQANCYLYDSRALWDCALDMLKKDISCFIKE